MVSVFNIEPHDIILSPSKVLNDYNYTFFNNIDHDKYNIKYKVYYELINSVETFKINNIYRYIYLRIYTINKKYDTIDCLLMKKDITQEDFNNILLKYIDNDIIKCILIINCILSFSCCYILKE